MNLLKLEKLARDIQIDLFKRSSSDSIGLFKSKFKGQGIQFKDHQTYSYGDELRFLDWKVLAKTGRPYIKTFEEERNVEVIVMVDASESMLMGYRGVSKLQASLEICFLIYLLAQKTKDRVKTVVFSDDIISAPIGVGKEGILKVLRILHKKNIVDDQGNVLIRYRPQKSINYQCWYNQMMSLIKKTSEVIFLSDFFNFLSDSKIKRMFQEDRYHGFQVISPIDQMNKWPYSLLGYSAGGHREKKIQTHKNLKGEKVNIKSPHDKMKIINVGEDYLSQFIMGLRNV